MGWVCRAWGLLVLITMPPVTERVPLWRACVAGLRLGRRVGVLVRFNKRMVKGRRAILGDVCGLAGFCLSHSVRRRRVALSVNRRCPAYLGG